MAPTDEEAPGQGHWWVLLRKWVALCVYCTLLAMSTAVCVCVRAERGGVTTDVLALSFLYMKISAALEQSLAQSDVTLYSRTDSWSQIWGV